MPLYSYPCFFTCSAAVSLCSHAQEEPVPYAKLNDPQSLNLYSYVLNHPLVGIDPDGHACDDANEMAVCHGITVAISNGMNAADALQAGHKAQQQTQGLVNAQNAAMANGNYEPTTDSNGNVTTHCSEAACAIAKGIGTNLTGILYDSKGNNYDANTQINNLANSPNYHVVTPDQAQALGDKGVLVFGTQHGARHGPIASVRPEGVPGDNPRGRSGPILANVGIFNGVAHQSAVMTPAHGAIIYYAPNQ